MPKKQKQALTLQVITTDVAIKEKKKANGAHKNGKDAQRTFEQRFERRYEDFPPLPQDLEKPTFSESALKVLKERYLLKGDDMKPAETVEERFWHIAYDLASADLDFGATKEQIYDTAVEFYRFMVRQEFMPNSPTIMNAGKHNGLQYSACFVLPVEDSLPGIFDTIKHAALIHQTGGGTGFAFSRLRPSGSPVKTSGGVASGPVSFLRVFNAATEAIKQGGTRRGANMGILRVDHPDIYEFIRCKAELDDLHKPVFDEIAPFLPDDEVRRYFKTKLLDTQISNFNISVAITDKFMEALAVGGEFDLINPRTKEVTGQLNAKAVFDEITERAWHTGDPGLVFIDRINQSTSNPLGEHGDIEATNPCVTADTLVATADGWKRVDDVNIGDSIGTIFGSGTVNEIEVHENIPVYKVTLSDGAQLRVTAAHQFHAIKHKDRAKNSANKKFSLISLKDLEVNDMVRIASVPMPDNPVSDLPNGWSEKEYGFFVGVLLGDGCITEKSLIRNVVKVAVNTSEKEWTEIIRSVLKKAGSKVVSLDAGIGLSANLTVQNSGGAAMLVKQSFITPGYSYEKRIPIEYQCTNRQFLAGLIDGLFSTDGNVSLTSNHPLLRLKTTSKQLAMDLRRILLCFGIHGRMVTLKKVKDGRIGDRVITSKHQQYEVLISGAGIKTFAESIGLSHPDKQKKLQEARRTFALTGNTWLARIILIEPDGVEKVYDLHEPVSDTWITEGVVSRGCGEQPLEPWDACNLGSINLGKFVLEDNSDVDWARLKEAAKKAVHMLDNVVQVNPYTLKQIYEKVHDIRRIGLGVMGWADMLFKLGIPYNSKQALALAEEVMKTINEEGHRSSESLAQIRGSFPHWSKSIYKNGRPLRNSTVTTIAPTGTISIIADCSSGIEPVFALAYIHKARSVGDQYRILTIANQTFTEIAKSEGFYTDDLAQKVLEHGSVSGLSEVPQKWQNVFITAPEIDSDTHVLMQAAFQKYTDNGVSKTINMPNSATVEDVRKAYLLAWETGCNGITIYRDGSKSVQVLNVSSTLKPKTTTQEEHKASESQDTFIHRPLVLTGRTYRLQTPVGEGFITINRDEKNQPFEVFVNIGKGGTHALADAEAVGRLISMALRLSRSPGVTPNTVAHKIADQLRNIGGASHIGFGKDRIMSLADAIGKAMAEDIAISESGQSGGEILPLNLTENTQDSMEALPLPSNPAGNKKIHADICPECGMASLVFAEGCSKCYSCGFSKC